MTKIDNSVNRWIAKRGPGPAAAQKARNDRKGVTIDIRENEEGNNVRQLVHFRV